VAAMASIESRLDLPTPEPAKMPSRCPAQTGVKRSRRARRWAAGAEPGAQAGRRRRRLNRIGPCSQARGPALVLRPAEGVDHPAPPARIGVELAEPPVDPHGSTQRDPGDLAVGCQQRVRPVEADHLGGDRGFPIDPQTAVSPRRSGSRRRRRPARRARGRGRSGPDRRRPGPVSARLEAVEGGERSASVSAGENSGGRSAGGRPPRLVGRRRRHALCIPCYVDSA
jgi:hypothetical protein